MSFLTKSFVVIVAVLAVLVVALIVPFVANTEDYKTKWTQEQQARLTAEQAANSRTAEQAAVQSKNSERIADLSAQIGGLNTAIMEREEKLASANGQIVAKDAAIADLEANIARLTSTSSQSVTLLEAFTKELNDSRAKLVDQQTKLVQSFDRINELQSQLGSLTRQVRRFKESTQVMAQRTRFLEGVLAKLSDVERARIIGSEQQDAAAVVPLVPITGEITEVVQTGGITIVQVNVGQGDGVEQNMKFLVHRDETFIGTLLIETVDTGDAAGHMDMIAQDVQAGDLVYAGKL